VNGNAPADWLARHPDYFRVLRRAGPKEPR
jgi:hypothetical protein